MTDITFNSKLARILYSVLLPIIVILLLLGIGSFIKRPYVLGSAASDFVVRLMLCAWFCGLYIRLSRLSTFSFFPGKKWSPSDVGVTEKYFYIGMAVLFSLGCGVVTWWAFRWFLPSFSLFAPIIAFINSVVVFLPLGTQYWVLKL